MSEWLDTKSNVKLGGFRSRLEISCVSSYTEQLWYNETVCLWMTIYISYVVPIQLFLRAFCWTPTFYITNPPSKTNSNSEPCGRSHNKLVNDNLLSVSISDYISFRRPAKTHKYQLSADIGCNLEDPQERWMIRMSGEERSGSSALSA